MFLEKRAFCILFFVPSDGLRETISCFVVTGTLPQPISKSQKLSHLRAAADLLTAKFY